MKTMREKQTISRKILSEKLALLYGNFEIVEVSGFDNKTSEDFLIEKLGGSKTIVIVAHRISTIKDSDIIFILEGGEVKGRGTFDELLATNKWFQGINR